MKRSMLFLVASLLLAAGGVLAQQYPNKPMRVVIPWPPGGSNDVVGRIVLQKVSESLGQQFVIDNRAGAAGSIGADVVAKAPADGYTLMVHSTKSVREFIALAKARPGQVNYSSSGNGSAPHLSMALFVSMTGIKLVHIPYKGGGPQVTALVSGETQVSLATISTVLAHINSGRLRALGVSSPKRAGALPGVPTIAEAGVPGYEMNPWIGVFAPAGTPKTIIGRLNVEINKALAMPDVSKSLSSQALDPWRSTPEEFDARLKADYEKYAKLVKLTGAQID